MRFRPEQHLRRPAEIRAVREQGRRIECRAFTVWWKRRSGTVAPTAPTPTPGNISVSAPASTSASAPVPARASRAPAPAPAIAIATPRVCVIASTAAVGGATRRNRAKRRLREIFRQQQHLVPRDCDLLLIARAAATDVDLGELQKKFGDACAQISKS